MLTPDLMMRLGTLALAVILGLAGACYALASFYYAPYANYALGCLVPCAALVWALPTSKQRRRS
ncbi:MAG: hypothetical protein ACLQJR_31380 [Stellaceae bacterium]